MKRLPLMCLMLLSLLCGHIAGAALHLQQSNILKSTASKQAVLPAKISLKHYMNGPAGISITSSILKVTKSYALPISACVCKMQTVKNSQYSWAAYYALQGTSQYSSMCSTKGMITIPTYISYCLTPICRTTSHWTVRWMYTTKRLSTNHIAFSHLKEKKKKKKKKKKKNKINKT